MIKMKNGKLQKRIDRYIESTTNREALYFTEVPMRYEPEHYGKRYFFCQPYTHKIVAAFNKQVDLIEYLEERGF